MARKVLEVSIFWAGELFAIKRFAATARVTLEELSVPASDAVVVRSELVDAGPRFARDRADLPLAAVALVAALLNTGTVASFTHVVPADVHASDASATSRVVATDMGGTFDGPATAPIVKTSSPSADLRCAGVADYLRANHLTRLPRWEATE